MKLNSKDLSGTLASYMLLKDLYIFEREDLSKKNQSIVVMLDPKKLIYGSCMKQIQMYFTSLQLI